MRRPDPRRAPGLWPLAAALLLGAGCTRPGGPPPIVVGEPCVACGMEVQDLRFACELRVDDRWRVYDAIECLMRDAGGATATAPGPDEVWLADYDTRGLHPADSAWVVRGAFASPMGGGFAAFDRRAAADSVAAATEGRVDRLRAFMADITPGVR